MRQTDCGIFPSRAEGWNLELLEMMACGKPCIATNYSAHTEFCTREDTWFIDIEETELAQDGKWFFGQGSWAKIGEKQIDQAVEHMRFMYKNRPNGLNSREQSKKFSWENSAEIFVKEIF
jgi:glycosyltransferase involved in cell wall biosynthesis